jgi:cytidylate kinase
MSTVICVDGPAASGKSTVSKLIAQKIGYLYVDSGALYRIVTWLIKEDGCNMSSTEEIAEFAKNARVDFLPKENRVAYEVKGREPGDNIRSPEINALVSPVSAVPEVRALVTGWLRGMRSLGNLVVEGRDIGSVVFPDSVNRFYLDADPDVRARRRHKEDVAKGFADSASEGKVKESLLNRDKIDSTRKTAPLTIPEGAMVIDTTEMTIEQVADTIIVNIK